MMMKTLTIGYCLMTIIDVMLIMFMIMMLVMMMMKRQVHPGPSWTLARFFPKLIKSSHAIFYHLQLPCLVYDGTDNNADADAKGLDGGSVHKNMDVHNTMDNNAT